MKRITIALPDDLAEAADNCLRSGNADLTLTSLLQAALRTYLTERGFTDTQRTLRITPARKGSRRRNIIQEHDRYTSKMHI